MMDMAEELAHLERLLKPLIKDATRIIVETPIAMPEHSNIKSHFGGQPYFEKGEKWPKAKNGKRLEFVFQIFNENNIALPENIKLIQFYYDFDENPWFAEDDGWLVKIYTRIHTENVEIIEKSKKHVNVNYCEITYQNIKSLPDSEGISSHTIDEEARIYGMNSYLYEEAVVKLIGETEGRSQLGGYPSWIQSNGEPVSSAERIARGSPPENYSFLFQLDSEDNAGLMWGDSGSVYVFYDEKNNKTEFVLQCY
jgi:uncharacterized protein YwqG